MFGHNTQVEAFLEEPQKIHNKPSRTAIFSVNGVQRTLIVHTPNQLQKETEFCQDNLDGDFFRRIQAEI